MINGTQGFSKKKEKPLKVVRLVRPLILELTHGLEARCKLLYNPPHGHVIIMVHGYKENDLIHELYCNFIQTIVIYYENRCWLTSRVVKQMVLLLVLDKTTWKA